MVRVAYATGRRAIATKPDSGYNAVKPGRATILVGRRAPAHTASIRTRPQTRRVISLPRAIGSFNPVSVAKQEYQNCPPGHLTCFASTGLIRRHPTATPAGLQLETGIASIRVRSAQDRCLPDEPDDRLREPYQMNTIIPTGLADVSAP